MEIWIIIGGIVIFGTMALAGMFKNPDTDRKNESRSKRD